MTLELQNILNTQQYSPPPQSWTAPQSPATISPEDAKMSRRTYIPHTTKPQSRPHTLNRKDTFLRESVIREMVNIHS